ncbi:MAG: tRNA (adenosine(37)-N6)-dimethylallyltransferase MiaA [Lachnospiraceae bacterium]|nr:tRNA (adenosine(37)-N6)-dimethylallyltransferase MiaA [Lachnospiraceae bacterium]
MQDNACVAKKKPLIVLTGPTAVGKTALSVKLAKALDAEIISADSMQVYKGMDIGSAKIRKEEMDGIRHHLIDILDPKEEFNVVLFQKLAKEAIADITGRGKIPILAGGTGFYIQAVLYDIDFTQTQEDTSYREALELLASQKGAQYLHDMLRKVDPASAEAIHANNVKRVIRALEFYKQTKQKISDHNQEQKENESAYDSCYFVLTDDREKMYERIDRRVDLMLEDGLVEEVRRLQSEGCSRELVSMQGLGYKEILAWLDGEHDLERAVYLIKRDTRHFAKRQLTWFKREKDVIWVDRREFKDENAVLQFMIDTWRNKRK